MRESTPEVGSAGGGGDLGGEGGHQEALAVEGGFLLEDGMAEDDQAAEGGEAGAVGGEQGGEGGFALVGGERGDGVEGGLKGGLTGVEGGFDRGEIAGGGGFRLQLGGELGEVFKRGHGG
jgi:hypothetical protein